MSPNRLEEFAVFNVRPAAFGNTQHHALTGAVDVCVQQTHFRTFRIQCEGQVHRRGGFTHAALTTADQDQMLNLTEAGTASSGKSQLQINVVYTQKLGQLSCKLSLHARGGITERHRNLIARGEDTRTQTAPRLTHIGVYKILHLHAGTVL